jgi:hypothetical protein
MTAIELLKHAGIGLQTRDKIPITRLRAHTLYSAAVTAVLHDFVIVDPFSVEFEA